MSRHRRVFGIGFFYKREHGLVRSLLFIFSDLAIIGETWTVEFLGYSQAHSGVRRLKVLKVFIG